MCMVQVLNYFKIKEKPKQVKRNQAKETTLVQKQNRNPAIRAIRETCLPADLGGHIKRRPVRHRPKGAQGCHQYTWAKQSRPQDHPDSTRGIIETLQKVGWQPDV